MKLNNKIITTNGKAAFYATIYDELKKVAMDCGWALGLHGSLANDMDIMAMPWTEDAKPVEEMIRALSNIFEDNPFKDLHTIPYYEKPNNRVVYTISIWDDWYLDINVIDTSKAEESKEPVIGDVVKITDKQRNNECYRGLYLGTNGVEYFVQITGDQYPTPFTVKHCDIKKTGKRVNLNYGSEV